MLPVTRRALERARALFPELARLDDDRARERIAAAVRAGAREETIDYRTGDPQAIVWLGPAGAPWGAALLKGEPGGEMVITTLDGGGARSLLARGRTAAARLPALERLPAGAGQLARFRVVGWPGVAEVVVLQDGTGVVTPCHGRDSRPGTSRGVEGMSGTSAR